MGDWASVLAIALSIGLWFMWPRVPVRVASPRPVNESTCAYIDLVNVPYSPLQMHRIFTEETSSVEDMTKLPSPPLPDIPAATVITSFSHPHPTYTLGENVVRTPLLQDERPPYPFSSPSLVSTGTVVMISESLKQANFTFERPGNGRSGPVTFSAHLVYSRDGRCISLLMDNASGDDAALLAWRTALQFSNTSTNASGMVTVR